MKATTVKADGELLRAIEEIKPTSQTVSAYVRSVLQRVVDSHRLQEAAVAYRAFVEANPQERHWLLEWDSADLMSSPSAAERRE